MPHVYWGEPFARSYMQNDHLAQPLRIALGVQAAWSEMPLDIHPEHTFVGHTWKPSVAGYNFGGGVYCREDIARELIDSTHDPEIRAFLDQVVSYFRGQTTGDKISQRLKERGLSGAEGVFWAGGWGGHGLVDYGKVLRLGAVGLKAEVERQAALRGFDLDAPPAPNGPPPRGTDEYTRQWYQALRVTCDTLCIVGDRFAEEALRRAEQEPDLATRRQLVQIADVCSRVPRYPARTWREALQSFWLIFCFEGIDSPGRFDQYMYPFYRASIDSGELTREQAFDLLEQLWFRFEEVRAWNLCVGGQTPDGRDATNDLSYMILELVKKHRFRAPNVTMRCHPGTPPELWRLACECISTGVAMPALYNDEAVIPALQRFGIPLEHARDYAMNGCNQIDIQGKSHMGLEDGELSLVKCLELALNDGFCPVHKRQVGPKTGDPRAFTSFDDLMRAYKQQVEYFTRRIVEIANTSQEVYGEHAPEAFRSLLTEGCIESGRDFKAGGPLYNHAQVLTQGIANAADSLMAVKTLVFDRREITMDELLSALSANFEGHEDLRQRLLHCPKYGNDHDDVDSIAKEIVEHFFMELMKYRTWRGGGIYGGGSSVYVRGIPFGQNVGATPEGRFAHTPLADSVGPVQGRDRSGPTAVLNSVSKIDSSLFQSGYVLNLRFAKSSLTGPDALAKLEALVKAFFARGGQQVQINVLNADDLRRAKENPDEYRSLVVRVGGFSEYFVNLSPELQDEIITRTEHML
ncbi:MAG: pyruvate formate lyase family protein [Armatimonadota bacterium]